MKLVNLNQENTIVTESAALLLPKTLHFNLPKLLHSQLPLARTDLRPNGFYPEALMSDFPVRGREVVLHVRRRRWLDQNRESVSTDWWLICKGTRYSKEFAAFLKEFVG